MGKVVFGNVTQYVLGGFHRLLGRRSRKDQKKLFSAIASEHIVFARVVRNDLNESLEQTVALIVAVDVVVVLEVVDIQ